MNRVELLKALRADLGNPRQAEFAKALGVTQSWISRLLVGKGDLSEAQIGRIYCLSVKLGDEARKRFSQFLKACGECSDG